MIQFQKLFYSSLLFVCKYVLWLKKSIAEVPNKLCEWLTIYRFLQSHSINLQFISEAPGSSLTWATLLLLQEKDHFNLSLWTQIPCRQKWYPDAVMLTVKSPPSNAGSTLQSSSGGQGQAGDFILKKGWSPQSALGESQNKSRWWPAVTFCLVWAGTASIAIFHILHASPPEPCVKHRPENHSASDFLLLLVLVIINVIY